MILKKEIKKKKNFLNFFYKFILVYFFSTLIIGILLITAILKSQNFEQKKIKYLNYLSEGGRIEYLYLPKIAMMALKSNFYKKEKINLEIKFNNSLILENVRNNALKSESGRLPKSELNPKVNFQLVYEDKKYPGDIRLKGDRKVHFEEKEKSSYKIKLDKDQYFFGINKFSLQKPRIRNYIHEWIFHQMAEDFDLIKIQYKFLDLSINGENKGLYVLEEGFGKELIERNKRRNGPIFGLDEDIVSELSIDINSNDIVFEIYNKKYWAKEENRKLVNIASQKLRNFLNQKTPIEDVLDIKKWAAYLSITDLTGTFHGTLLKSVKFYYNPINGLFEPIPFDGHRYKQNYHKYKLRYDNTILIDKIRNPSTEAETKAYSWLKSLFYKENGEINALFYNEYIKSLNTISSKKYLDKFIKENMNEIKKINSHIYADYFYYDNSKNYGVGLYYFLLSDFYYQAKNIRNKLDKEKKIQITKKLNSEYLIKIFNPKGVDDYSTLLIDRLICNNENEKIEFKINRALNINAETTIKISEDQYSGLRCTQAVLFDEYNKKSILVNIDHLNSEYAHKSFKDSNSEILKKYFVKENQNLYLFSDEVKINENIYIPKGFRVIIKPGQKLLLTNNAFIVSKSPWSVGGEGKEVIISGEKDNLGGGILISDNMELSEIKNTKISYLKGYDIINSSEFLIYGSMNFHQTNVKIQNVKFEKIFSEDALNIFRSNFKISKTDYKDIYSDAIDIDFSEGEITSVRFKNIENDAIDFSGSIASIKNSYFDNVNDKLISAGENSKINISKITALNSYAGIISKDSSKVYSNDINFENVKIPFAAYQKKKEYNHGLLVIKNFDVNNYSSKMIKDKNSTIITDGVVQNIETKEILSIFN